MSEETWARIVQWIGGEELLTYDYLATGAHNDNFRLEWSQEGRERTALVRVSISKRPGALESEYCALLTVGGTFGPKPLLYLKADGERSSDILVEELIQRPQLKRTDSDGTVAQDFVEVMGPWYSRLHSHNSEISPTLGSSGCYDLTKSIEWHVLRRYAASSEAVPETLQRSVGGWIDRLLKLGEAWRSYFGRNTVSLIQGDPTIGNVFFWRESKGGRPQVLLVDWEFSRYDLPEFDLVFFMDTYDLPERKREVFLWRYGYPQDKRSRAGLLVIWLVHIFSIIAWRAERLLHLREGELTARQSSSSEGDLIRGIEGGLEKARGVWIRLKNSPQSR